VTIIADGSKALSGSQDKTFRVWDLNTSAYLKPQDRSRGHSEGVIDIAVARDGSSCVSSSMDGTFKIWNCKTAQECFTLKGSQDCPFEPVFHFTVTKLHVLDIPWFQRLFARRKKREARRKSLWSHCCKSHFDI
jgi:WD40 repeat protein